MEILDNWVQVVPSTRVVGLRLARQDSHFTFAEAFHPDRYTNKTAIADYWLLCQYYPFTESSPGLYVFDYPADVGAFLKNRSNVLLERLQQGVSSASSGGTAGGRLTTFYPANPLWDLANGLRYVQKRLDELTLGSRDSAGRHELALTTTTTATTTAAPSATAMMTSGNPPSSEVNQGCGPGGSVFNQRHHSYHGSVSAIARRRSDIAGRFGVERRDLLTRKKIIKRCILHYMFATQSMALLSVARSQQQQHHHHQRHQQQQYQITDQAVERSSSDKTADTEVPTGGLTVAESAAENPKQNDYV